jgi:diguanylate cyclase (GGDEF)-like protein/PAS domain S-box-containing protein
MYRVFSCLTEQHDYRLVLLAVIICAATSLTSFSIYSRAVQGQGLSKLGWLFLTGLSTGSGIWATHFVSMLSYSGGLPTAYDCLVTTVSLLVAVGSTTFGFFVCSQGTRLDAGVGGALIGLGIAIMHFTGMRALIVPGTLVWDLPLVAAALLVGVTLGPASMLAFQRSQNFRGVVAAAVLFTSAICGLHFTAMGAALIEPDPTIVVEGFAADAPMMALAIAVVTVLVLLAGLAAALIDRQTTQDSIDSIRELVDAASEGIVIAEDGVIVNVNRRVCELSGRSAEDLVGLRIVGDLLDDHARRPPKDGLITAETSLKAAGGLHIPVEIVCQPFRAKLRGNEVYAVRDLTERLQNERQIAHMARHDALTDLPNRSLLWERLEQSIERVGSGEALAVICLDLDRFKEVNDTLGHAVGDAVLKIVAERLRGCVRSTDTIARLGGDEFAVLQNGAPQPVGATSLATRIIEALSEPYRVDDHQIMVGASVGIALSPDDSVGAGQLLQSADMALYSAKHEGRSTYRFFEQGMDARMRARRALETELRNALPNGEFELYYQPVVNLAHNHVSGFEALLRWNHPQRGLISPAEFIPLAEETGLVNAIGEWVLRQACAEAVKWAGDLKIAVNLSPCQFRGKNLVDAVFSAIAASGLAAHRLELDITESVLLTDADATMGILRQLQAIGVRIALDDFGTGYSSLSHLRSFPFDKIKIDRSFVNGLTHDNRESLAIVRAVSQMGASLGMCTTAEGVETESQLDALRAEGCTEVQGYFFSAARPAHEIAKLLLNPAAA